MSQILVIARVRDLGSRLHTPSQFFFAYPSRGGGGGEWQHCKGNGLLKGALSLGFCCLRSIMC